MVAVIAREPIPNGTEEIVHEFAAFPGEEQETENADDQNEQHLLVARALQGEMGAFDEIIERYRGLMLRVAYGIVRDQDVAEDAVQNAVIQAWQHLPNLRQASALRSWLMRIVVNQCISFKRRMTRSTQFLQQTIVEQEIERASQVANDAGGVIERYWDLARAIKDLPEKQQTVISLHYYQGMTLPEISRVLQTSQNTLKKRIQAALGRLRQELRSVDIDEAIFVPGPQ